MTPRNRPPLTQDEIVETALRLVDAEGLDALSMRRLGKELGVEAMALYRHVPSKDALVDLTVERMRAEVQLTAPLPEEPAGTLAAIFAEYRRVLLAHPNLLPLAARRTETGSLSGLEFLVKQGMNGDDAVALYQSLLAFTVGFALLGASDTGADWVGLPDDLGTRFQEWRDETFQHAVEALIASYGLE